MTGSFWGRWRGWLARLVLRRSPLPPLARGARVRLRIPLSSQGTVWIRAGASGVVVGGEAGDRLTVELDEPRTLITVPRAWLDEEPSEGGASRPSTPPGPSAQR